MDKNKDKMKIPAYLKVSLPLVDIFSKRINKKYGDPKIEYVRSTIFRWHPPTLQTRINQLITDKIVVAENFADVNGSYVF